MIPDIISVIFLIIPWACLVYIFRGVGEEQNPLWGNVLASGISFVVCLMIAIWFFSGTVVSPTVVVNATYQISTDMTAEEMLAEQAELSNTTEQLGAGGSGMFVRSAISTSGNVTNSTEINVRTYDIIYQQYQDFGIMALYVFLGLISVALFLWSVSEMRTELTNQRDDANNDGE